MQVTVKDIYEIELQQQDEKTFTDRESGEKVTIPAQKARNATVCIVQYNESTVPVILPEHFSASRVSKGCTIDIQCTQLEQMRPFTIKNVNRVLEPKAK